MFRIPRLVADPFTGVRTKKLGVVTLNPTIRVNAVEFRVKGTVVHEGAADIGHYVYYPFNERGEPTLRISDAADPINARGRLNEINKNAIVVLYERTGADVAAAAVAAARAEEAALGERRANYNEYLGRKAIFETRKNERVVPLRNALAPLRTRVSNLRTQKQTLLRNKQDTNKINADIAQGIVERNAAEAVFKAASKEFEAEQAALNANGNRIIEEIRQRAYNAARGAPGGGGRRRTHKRRHSKKKSTRRH